MSILMEPKGICSQFLVNVGDQVTAGQPIVQYSSTEAQTAYDAAVRAVNKADRQLNDLLTNGVTIDTTGDEEADAKSASQTQRTVDSQASDLRDAKSDAVDNMNKAKALLDATTVRGVIQMVPWSKSIKMFQNRLQGPTKLWFTL